MLVNSSLCTADKPEIEQICNDDSCPAKWVTGNWSEVGDYVCYIVKIMKDAASDVQSVITSFSESYTVLKTAPEDTYFGA